MNKSIQPITTFWQSSLPECPHSSQQQVFALQWNDPTRRSLWFALGGLCPGLSLLVWWWWWLGFSGKRKRCGGCQEIGVLSVVIGGNRENVMKMMGVWCFCCKHVDCVVWIHWFCLGVGVKMFRPDHEMVWNHVSSIGKLALLLPTALSTRVHQFELIASFSSYIFLTCSKQELLADKHGSLR